MRLQIHKKNRAEKEYSNGNAPVHERYLPSIPEPYFVDKAVSVSLDQVKDRIDSEEYLVLFRNDFYCPEYRRAPEKKLEHRVHERPHVAEKNNSSWSYPRNSDQQYQHREYIVSDLQEIERRIVSIYRVHDDQKKNEKNMDQ